MIEFYTLIIKDFKNNMSSVNYFFSHYADKTMDMKKLMEAIIKGLGE